MNVGQNLQPEALESRPPDAGHAQSTAALSLLALGVVYGDIGTSPLYAVKETFNPSHGIPFVAENILGGVSAIFWALMVVVSLKYVLLILRADMPRSLHACLNEVVNNLEAVTDNMQSETLRHAGKLRADLAYGRIDEILATGLHAYLTQFLERVNVLGGRISREFLMPQVG